jgi:hypothetical protein
MVEVINNLFELHIKGSQPNAIVADKTALLCKLTNTVLKVVVTICGLQESDPRVYINTRIIKHLFDKKPAEEFLFIVSNAHKIVKYPDHIYKNKNPKRGDVCFTKKIQGHNYICSLQIDIKEIYLVTMFRVRKESYLQDYELLWSWRDGAPSS